MITLWIPSQGTAVLKNKVGNNEHEDHYTDRKYCDVKTRSNEHGRDTNCAGLGTSAYFKAISGYDLDN